MSLLGSRQTPTRFLCINASARGKYLHRWVGKEWRNQLALRSGSIDQIMPESNDALPTQIGIQLYLQLQPLHCSDCRLRNHGGLLEQCSSQPAQRFQRRRAKHGRLFSSFDKLEPSALEESRVRQRGFSGFIMRVLSPFRNHP